MRRRRGRLTARWIFQESGSSQDLGVAVVAPVLVLVVAALRVRRQLLPLPRRPDPNAIPRSQFFEVAGRGANLPLQPWAAELKKKRMADNSKDNPDVWCLPIGLMQYHNHPQPRQIVQTKNLMLITYESNYGLRYIYMDGRPAPNNDPTPWWFGYSRGWWEGRYAGRRDDELPRRREGRLARRQRQPVHRRAEDDRALPSPELRHAGDRRDHRRPEGLYEAVHRAREPADHGGPEMIEFICNENERSTHHIEPPEWTKKPATTK